MASLIRSSHSIVQKKESLKTWLIKVRSVTNVHHNSQKEQDFIWYRSFRENTKLTDSNHFSEMLHHLTDVRSDHVQFIQSQERRVLLWVSSNQQLGWIISFRHLALHYTAIAIAISQHNISVVSLQQQHQNKNTIPHWIVFCLKIDKIN